MAAITVSDLRRRWAAGRPVRGIWSRLPGVVTAELLARSGPDYVVFDLQHGALDEADLPGVTAAVVAAGAVPLVPTRSPHVADIGRPLDLGAHGCSCRTCAAPTTSAKWSARAGTPRRACGRPGGCPEDRTIPGSLRRFRRPG